MIFKNWQKRQFFQKKTPQTNFLNDSPILNEQGPWVP